METQKQICISDDVHVAVNNIKGFGVVTERKQVVPFALLSSYRIFRGAVNNAKISKSVHKGFDRFVRFEPNLEFLDGFSLKSPTPNFMKIRVFRLPPRSRIEPRSSELLRHSEQW